MGRPVTRSFGKRLSRKFQSVNIMTEDQIRDIYRLILGNLRNDFRAIKETINGLGFKVEIFRRTHVSLKNLASTIPDDHELKHDIDLNLEVYNPDFLTGLDEEQFETICKIEEFIKAQYGIGKYEGREAVSLFRKIIKLGKFPPGYLAEFDKRF